MTHFSELIQCKFYLSEQAKKGIAMLAALDGVSQYAVVEDLVRKELARRKPPSDTPSSGPASRDGPARSEDAEPGELGTAPGSARPAKQVGPG